MTQLWLKRNTNKQTIASLFLEKMTEQWKAHLTKQLIHASNSLSISYLDEGTADA